MDEDWHKLVSQEQSTVKRSSCTYARHDTYGCRYLSFARLRQISAIAGSYARSSLAYKLLSDTDYGIIDVVV